MSESAQCMSECRAVSQLGIEHSLSQLFLKSVRQQAAIETRFGRKTSIAVPAPEFGLAAPTDSENAMSTLSFAPAQKAKTSLRPSRQVLRRAAIALAAALAVAGAADFGHYYLTTGRYFETTDDAYVKADST